MSMKRADNEAKTESSDLISDVRDAENDVVFARHLIARLHMRKCIQNLRNRMSGILLFPHRKRVSCLRQEYANDVRVIGIYTLAMDAIKGSRCKCDTIPQLGAQFHLNLIGARDPQDWKVYEKISLQLCYHFKSLILAPPAHFVQLRSCRSETVRSDRISSQLNGSLRHRVDSKRQLLKFSKGESGQQQFAAKVINIFFEKIDLACA